MDRDVGKMFVVDHVKKEFFNHRDKVRELNDKKALVIQKIRNIPEHRMNVINVCKDIVPAHSVSLAVFAYDGLYAFCVKVAVQGCESVFVCLLRKVFRRIYAYGAHPLFHVAGNKKTVVAANVYGKR